MLEEDSLRSYVSAAWEAIEEAYLEEVITIDLSPVRDK